jgi:hypothetical protein
MYETNNAIIQYFNNLYYAQVYLSKDFNKLVHRLGRVIQANKSKYRLSEK